MGRSFEPFRLLRRGENRKGDSDCRTFGLRKVTPSVSVRKKVAEAYRTFGKAIPRVDGYDKLTGKALYAGDLSFPGMLQLKVLRSNRPHARILRVHTEEAERHPGVVTVLTHGDIPGANR